MTPEQKADAARLRDRVKRLFNPVPEIRDDAREALKESWLFDEPSFRIDELAHMPAENCTLAAARRDGQREVLNWLMKL